MPDERLAQAVHYLDMQRPERARPLLAALLQNDPDDAEVLALAAAAALRTGEPDSARDLLARALQQDPGHVLALGFLFELHREAGEYAQAEAVVLQILRQEPEDAYWIAEYAALMVRCLQLEKAGELAAEALRLNPQEPGARSVSVVLSTARGDRSATQSTLASLVSEDPDSAATALALLTVLLEEKRYAEALRVAQQLLRAFPHDSDYVDLVIDLKASTHWFAWPAWPVRRFGWMGAFGSYLVAMVVLQTVDIETSPVFVITFASFWFLWVIHSWVHAPLLRRWFRSRGV